MKTLKPFHCCRWIIIHNFFFKSICCRKIINICVLNAQMKGFSDSTPSPGCLPEDNHVYFPLRCTPLCTSEQQCWRVQQGCIEKQTLTAIICKGQSVTLWSLGSCMKNVSFQRDTRPKIKAAQRSSSARFLTNEISKALDFSSVSVSTCIFTAVLLLSRITDSVSMQRDEAQCVTTKDRSGVCFQDRRLTSSCWRAYQRD